MDPVNYIDEKPDDCLCKRAQSNETDRIDGTIDVPAGTNPQLKDPRKMEQKVRITELTNSGDGRGVNFTVPAEALAFVGRMSDVYLAETKPRAIRGNHY